MAMVMTKNCNLQLWLIVLKALVLRTHQLKAALQLQLAGCCVRLLSRLQPSMRLLDRKLQKICLREVPPAAISPLLVAAVVEVEEVVILMMALIQMWI